ncbi:MAG: 16S rRNA (uracil(1498)-N(3))-methyltransferase [Candidatus Acidiferrum sp.]
MNLNLARVTLTMRRRFFIKQFDGARAVMEGDGAHHVGRVLRAQPGQLYELSDGERVWLGRVESVGRERVEFALLEKVDAYQPQLEVTLLLAVVKFDSFEWALEKATELGVRRILPLAAERSEKGLLAAAVKRSERWGKLLMEASQQSRRVRVPVLSAVMKPEQAFAEQREGRCVMLSERADAPALREVLASGAATAKVVLSIGPEGGWTDGEIVAAQSAGFVVASLGKLILRTETAVIASLAAINYALGLD